MKKVVFSLVLALGVSIIQAKEVKVSNPTIRMVDSVKEMAMISGGKVGDLTLVKDGTSMKRFLYNGSSWSEIGGSGDEYIVTGGRMNYTYRYYNYCPTGFKRVKIFKSDRYYYSALCKKDK